MSLTSSVRMRLLGAVVGGAFVLGLWPGSAPSALAQAVGMKGGVPVSSIVFSDDFAETTPLSPGMTGGATVGFGLWWQLTVRAEALFTLERATIEDGPESQFRYLEVPVLVRRPLPGLAAPWGRAIIVEAGVAWRRLLEARESIGGESYSITDGVRDHDLGLAVGVEVPVASKWGVAARFMQGGRDIYRRASGQYSGRWRSVQLAVHYALWH